jgi:hypothetical protein
MATERRSRVRVKILLTSDVIKEALLGVEVWGQKIKDNFLIEKKEEIFITSLSKIRPYLGILNQDISNCLSKYKK